MGKDDFIFKWPAHATLNARSSTISNAFVQTFTPWITEKDNKVQELYNKYVDSKFDSSKCFYCGADATSSDHIIPLVSDRKPTGAITEIYNLLPCCNSCNSAKGSKTFEDFYKDFKEQIMKTLKDENVYNARLRDIPQLIKELQELNPRKNIMTNGLYDCYFSNMQISKDLQHIMHQRDELIEIIKKYHIKCLNVCNHIEKELLDPQTYIRNRFNKIIATARKIYTANPKSLDENFKESFLKKLDDLFGAKVFSNMHDWELRVVRVGTKNTDFGKYKNNNDFICFSRKTILGEHYHCVVNSNCKKETAFNSLDDRLTELEKFMYE